MLRFSGAFVLCLAGLSAALHAEGPVLMRDAEISSVGTFQGSLAARVVPVIPEPDVTLVILSDTLQPEDLPRLRRSFAALTASFLAGRRLRIIEVSGDTGDVSSALDNPAQLQAALKRIPPAPTAMSTTANLFTVLGSIANSLPGNWSQAVIVGRFPTSLSDESWIAAWIGETYRTHKIRTSFWSLDGTAPGWCLNLSASTLGTVATDDFRSLLMVLEDTSGSFFEATWQTNLPRGAWAYAANLKTQNGDRALTVQSLANAAGFVLPIAPYLSSRAAMATAAVNDLATPEAVLALNASDDGALRKLAAAYAEQNKPKQSMEFWKRLVELLPGDANAWVQLAAQSYAGGAYADASRALKQATELGANNEQMVELEARLRFRRNDFAGALPLLDQVLSGWRKKQDLWLLRADCAVQLKQWGIEAESLERAISLGPTPMERRTALIAGYLSHGSPERALPHLRAATDLLPGGAAVRAQYATFWEQENDGAAAEKLWKASVEMDATYEPAYVGLARFYLNHKRAAEAVKVANAGLEAAPESMSLVLAKENALEAMGDLYSARGLLNQRFSSAKDLDILKRRARMEDWYGTAGADAYTALLNALIEAEAPQNEVVAVCRRGLQVALRGERWDAARFFAEKLKGWGDASGLALIGANRRKSEAQTEIPGGADALSFLLLRKAKTKPDRFFLDYSRALAIRAMSANKTSFRGAGQAIHEYFEQVAAISALGARKGDNFEIVLSLNDKPGRQRTSKVFNILGLKLNRSKKGLTIESAVGKPQAKKQDALGALAVDDGGIQEALAAGKSYILEIPVDRAPIFPAADLWKTAFYDHQQYAGGLAEAFTTDPKLPQLCLALNSMDRRAAEVLLQKLPLRTLAERYSLELSQFSAALALSGKSAEVPGGRAAYPIWRELTGSDPDDPALFFQALLNRDDGKLIAFFYTLSQLDMAHRQFFTRSPERAKRFYELFRDSAETRRASEHELGSTAFLEFLREVPLNTDGSVDFPGGPEVWMVAKGASKSAGALANLGRKAKKKTAPDDEDEILVRLGRTEYKAQTEQSELANFIAVARIDAQRKTPLSSDSALLLAQNYSSFRALYAYLTSLGDLEAADFSKFFSLAEKLQGLDAASANLHLGELHSFLALLSMGLQSGVLHEPIIRQLYRKGLDRYSNAQGPPEWTDASLSNLDDLVRSASVARARSHDAALEALLLGDPEEIGIGAVVVNPARQRQENYRRVLDLQKAPSLDSLFAIRDALAKVIKDSSAVDAIQKEIASFVVMTPPKNWKTQGAQRKYLERYQTADMEKTLAKLRDKLAKNKRNPGDILKLSAELLAQLEPWTELAMTGQVYARYLDPSDLIVSEDPMLLRKHEFVDLALSTGKRGYFMPATFNPSSQGEGSFFVGGFAEFSSAAGEARSLGNHLGGASGEAIGSALFASIRGTDWRSFTAPALQMFAARVRVAREWIVQSAESQAMLEQIEEQSLGLLSLSRRARLMGGIRTRNWPEVWDCVSISDLYFLGDSLIEHSPAGLWTNAALEAMKIAAGPSGQADGLGQVAPHLSGCAEPRLRRYEPYEEYQRYTMPDRIAERVAELKLYLAWQADSLAWPPEAIAAVALPAADAVLRKLQTGDLRDWRAALDAYRGLDAKTLESLLGQP